MRRARRAVSCLAIGVAGACASGLREDPWPARGASAGEVVGYLDGQPVALEEVARHLRSRDPEAFARNLESYLLSRLAREEAARVGITLPEAAIQRATARRMAEWEARVRAASRAETGEEIAPELWLHRVAGISLAEFRATVREQSSIELLEDRLLRYEQLVAPGVEVSLLVTRGREEAERMLARLRAGDAMEKLAREHSVHESAKEGGRIPFRILPVDLEDAAVREALFSAGSVPGQVLGPFAAPGPEKGFEQIYRLEAVHPQRPAGYAALEAEISSDLEKRPVSVGEYERWRRRILLRHGFAAAPGETG